MTDYTRSRRRSFPGGVTAFSEDRVCVDRSCDTQLSRYNGSDRCSVHDGTVARG